MIHPDQSPLFVFHDFEETPGTPEGGRLAAWPLHLTVTPFGFTLRDVQKERAIETITEIAEAALPIEIVRGDDALYGPNNDIPVTKISNANGELQYFHTELIHKLGELGCHFTDLTYALDNYSPHITRKPHAPILTDAGYITRSISIGQKFVSLPKPNKVILKRIEL